MSEKIVTKKKRSKKQQQLLDTSQELFWKHGVSRVTVTEICEKAGVSKMTFYRLFDNKTELAKELLLELGEQGLRQFQEVRKEELSFPEKIRKMIALKRENTGLISEELIQDIYQNEALGLMKFLEAHAQRVMGEFQDFIEEAQAKGEISPSIKPAFVLFFLNQIQQWLAEPQVTQLFDDPQDMIMEVTNLFFYGITQSPSE
jgi:AcrR family transcriptional regulator